MFSKNSTARANSSNRERFVKILHEIADLSMEVEFVEKVNSTIAALNMMGVSSKYEVSVIDLEIEQALERAKGAAIDQKTQLAILELKEVSNLLRERSKYCSSSGRKTKDDEKAEARNEKLRAKVAKKAAKAAKKNRVKIKVKTRADELRRDIEEESAKIAFYNSELDKLMEESDKNPDDESLIAQATIYDFELNASKRIVKSKLVELKREARTTGQDREIEEYEQTVLKRTVSEDEDTVARNRLAEIRKMQAADAARENTARVEDEAAGGLDYDPFASRRAAKKQAGVSTPGGISVAAVSVEKSEEEKQYDALKSQYEGVRAIYNKEMEDAQRERDKLDEKLRDLLIQRDEASSVDCVALDCRIDQLYAERNNLEQKILRNANEASILTEQISLINSVCVEKGVEAKSAAIAKMTGGAALDLEGLALFVKKRIEEGNQRLVEAGTAASVAKAPIDTRTMTGASAQYAEAVGEKDEHKYDELKRKLKMSV